MLLSLLIHTLLLRLTFGGEGLWLPGFSFPWQDRRIEVPDLRVVLFPAPVTAAEPAVKQVAQPLQQAAVEQAVARGPRLTPSVSRAPNPGRTEVAIVPEAYPAEAEPRTDAATDAAPAKAPLRAADRPADAAPPPIPAPEVIALARTDAATWVVPAPAMPAPVVATTPSASTPHPAMPSLRDAGDAARARIDQVASEGAVEPAELDPSKQEEQRQGEQLETARQEDARREAAQAEKARLEAARQEAARQEAAREAVARAEASRQEAARQEAARQEAARQEAAHQEAARQEAARQEAARQGATQQEATRQEAQEAATRREATLRAIGRQLDEEAARREAATAAARQSPSLPYSWSSARRYRLFGRTDPNAEIILYAEAWSRKIELNMTFDMVREAAKQPHTDPVVIVAIRSNGSVESVTFVKSSGVPAIDDAIRRVVDSQTPYQVFPPGLARDYDVIEIRRNWHFDIAIRLH